MVVSILHVKENNIEKEAKHSFIHSSIRSESKDILVARTSSLHTAVNRKPSR